MARVTVTEYESEHDLLPPVCVRCGGPAGDSLVRTFRRIDGAGRWGFWHTLAALYGLLVFPPFLPWALRRARTVRIKVPFCGVDRAKTVRQERIAFWVVVPIWIAGVLVFDAFIVIEQFTGRPGSLGVAVLAIPLYFAALEALTRLPAAPPGQSADRGVPLTGVDPAFVAALLEDRARDRVANPDRRALRGDIRDDYDEEAV